MSGKGTAESLENAIRTKIWSYLSAWFYWHMIESLVRVRLRAVKEVLGEKLELWYSF